MALFSRIFQVKKNRTPSTKWYRSETSKTWIEPTFSQSQVRLVIFRDQDFKGRGLLFDSKAIHKVETEQNEKKGACKFGCNSRKPPATPEDAINHGNSIPKYEFSRPGSDVKMLEEMVFGAVGMAFRGSSLKIHTIRSPAQLMLTKVFASSLNRTRESDVESESLDLSLNCSSTELTSPQNITDKTPQSNSNMAQSIPVDVPSPTNRGYFEHETEDSGFSTSAASSLSSFAASLPHSSSSSSLTSNSLNSMTRRWRRNQQTSLENNILKRQSDEGVCDQPVPLAKRPPKIGIAIIIYLPDANGEASKEFQDFFFSHITLIEGLVNKLRVGVERALSSRKQFFHMTMEALQQFRQLIEDLYLTPRLEEPVWLDMMCYATRRVSLCQRFLKEFMTAVSKYDTKNCKFFLSTLITGVLTHHLAWVPTVTPAGATPSRTYLDKHSAKWLDAVARSHPYNPLWAQLGDLYGAIGFPVRLSRTVIVGKKSDLVNKILYILSYFIRCSEVYERIERPHDFDEFDLDEDAPEISMDGPIWSDRDTISQTSSCSDTRSFSTSTTVKQPELLSNGCSQCQAIREATLEGNADDIICSKLSPHTCNSTGDSTMMKLNQSEDISKHKGGTSRLNDPGGTTNVVDVASAFNFEVDLPLQRTVDFVNGLHRQSEINEKDNYSNSGEEAEYPDNNYDLSLAYPCTVIGKEQTGGIKQSPQSAHRDNCDTSTTTAATTEQFKENALECRMSPTRVNEEPVRANIRYVGKEAVLDIALLPDNGNAVYSSKHQHKADSQLERGHHPLGESIRSETSQRNEFCHDSGVYDTEITTDESHLKDELTVWGSRVGELSPKSTSRDENSGSKKALQHSSLYSQPLQCVGPAPDIESSSSTFGFNRTNSMFDEYFMEESEPVSLVRNPPSRNKSEAERFKRMASIEGSSSVFDEYLVIPCPDIHSRISEVSDTAQHTATTLDTDVSIFDEYFSDNEKGVEINEHTTVVSETNTSPKKQEPVSSHIADRRNVKRPESLSVKSTGVDGDRQRARQPSGHSSGTITASRTFSASPNEFNRRRHASNLSTTSSIEADVFHNLQEVNMPRCELLSAEINNQSPKGSFSRSLMAGYSDHYLSDFVLHGTCDSNFQAKLHNDLTMSVQSCVLDEPIAEASCVLADMDQWSVKLLTCHNERPDRIRTSEVSPSPLICNIIESIHDLWRLKMSPEFCLMHLEDRLQEIFFKSRTLAEYIRSQKKLDIRQLATLLKLDYNDIPLLLAVAGTHTPHRYMAFL